MFQCCCQISFPRVYIWKSHENSPTFVGSKLFQLGLGQGSISKPAVCDKLRSSMKSCRSGCIFQEQDTLPETNIAPENRPSQ